MYVMYGNQRSKFNASQQEQYMRRASRIKCIASTTNRKGILRVQRNDRSRSHMPEILYDPVLLVRDKLEIQPRFLVRNDRRQIERSLQIPIRRCVSVVGIHESAETNVGM